MSTNTPFFTDRSRQVQFEKCPRARFWSTVYGEWGIQPAVPNLDLELGIAIHEGVAALLDGKGIDEALTEAFFSLGNALGTHFPVSIIQSYADLTEGLLRAFEKIQYPKLKAKFQLVGPAEQEMTAFLMDGVAHMSRPDAVLKDKMKDEYGVWSLKTTSFSDDAELELQYRTDTQGLAEMWAAEQFFKTKMSWSQLLIIHTGAKERIADGTGEGVSIHLSPVYQGWYKDDGLGTVQLAHSYWWKDAVGKRKGLGQVWKRFNVAEMYTGGIAQWIEDLAAGKIQPEVGNVLEGLFLLPPAYYRREESIQEWRLATGYQENHLRIWSEAYHNECIPDDTKNEILHSYFPQHRSSCIYMRHKCDFYQLCHGTAGEAENPFDHGFKWREINHPQEKRKGEV